jgi:phosphoadenosine phosphosulfate reductase
MALDDRISTVISLLQRAARDYAPTVFASSFGAEDMVLTDLIAKHAPAIGIFSLDTGRLPEETHRLMQTVTERYRITVRTYHPEHQALENFQLAHGANAFYRSVELRKECCQMRKVEPLKRALAGKKAWITGLRREQAQSRVAVAESAFDADYGLHKFNPLADWSNAEVWEYLRRFDVPYNALHDRGYPSIGCAPCTRAVSVGEDPRAGRWWWENEGGKECGLHERQRIAQPA